MTRLHSNTDELRRAFKMLTGSGMEILFLLHQRSSFRKLKRSCPYHATYADQSTTGMEADGLISRKSMPRPPRVSSADACDVGFDSRNRRTLSWCRENSPRIQVRQTQLNRKSKSAARVAETLRGDAASEDLPLCLDANRLSTRFELQSNPPQGATLIKYAVAKMFNRCFGFKSGTQAAG